MKNILIQWVLPTTRQGGGPLPIAEIKHVTLELSANAGVDWSPLGNFPPATLEAPVNDLPFSDQYAVRGFVVDVTDQAGNTETVPFVVDDGSPPGDLVVSVTFP
jgi:hypothetical protein